MEGNPRPNGKFYGIPQPQSRFSHYIIPGQCIEDFQGRHHPTAAVKPMASSFHVSDDAIDMTSLQLLRDAQEQVHMLLKKLANAQQEIQQLEAQLCMFSGSDQDLVMSPHSHHTPATSSAPKTSGKNHHASNAAKEVITTISIDEGQMAWFFFLESSRSPSLNFVVHSSLTSAPRIY
jgi:hypothetical protein